MILGVDDIKQFQVFFDVVYEDVSEIEFQVFPEKIICSLLDKSHINFYTVRFDKEFFSIYEISDVESFVVDMDDLYKLLKSSEKSSELLLEVDGSNLVATITSKNGNRRVFEYTLVDDIYSSPSPPPVSFETSFDVDVSDLKQSVVDLRLIGNDLFKMNVSGDSLFVSSGRDALTKYSHEIYIEPEIPTKSIVSNYSVGYIEKLLKFSKVNKVVEIEFGADKPLSYIFNGDNMCIQGLVAPRFVED